MQHPAETSDDKKKVTLANNAKKRLKERVVSIMEQYPVARKPVFPQEKNVGVKKHRMGGLPRYRAWSKVAAHRKGEHSTSFTPAAPITNSLGNNDASREEYYSQSYARMGIVERIRAETMRRAHMLIEQQLRLRRAEAEFMRWTSNTEQEEDDDQQQQKEERKAREDMNKVSGEGNTREPVPSASPLIDPSVSKSNNDEEEVKIKPLVDIRSIKGLQSKTRFPLLFTPEDPDQRRQYLLGGPLRGLLERPRGNLGIDGENTLCVHNSREGVVAPSGNTATILKDEVALTHSHEALLLPPATTTTTTATTATASQGVTEETSNISVRRLIGVPEHNRGLYAGLTEEWRKASKAKALMRMILRGRARSSTWWRLAGSREGMLAAAKALGLDSATYQALVTRWMQTKKGDKWTSAVAAATVMGTGSTAGTNGEDSSVLPSLLTGDEELMDMLQLARQLGRLEMSGAISSDGIARLLEQDEDTMRQQLEHLMNSDEMRRQAGLLFASSEEMANVTDDASFHELAKALLQEKRRATLSARKLRKGENASLQDGTTSPWEKRPDSHGRDSFSEIRECLPLLTKPGIHGEEQMTEEEAAAYWKSMSKSERQAVLAAAKAKAKAACSSIIGSSSSGVSGDADSMTVEGKGGISKIGATDIYAHLPPLRGLDEGKAYVQGTQGGRKGRKVASESQSVYYTDDYLSRTSSVNNDILGATKKPSEMDNLPPSSADAKGGKGGDDNTSSLPDDNDEDNAYRGPEWWNKKRPTPQSKGIRFSPDDDDNNNNNNNKDHATTTTGSSGDGGGGTPGSNVFDGYVTGADLVELFTPPRQRRRSKQYQQQQGGVFDDGSRTTQAETRAKGETVPPSWIVENLSASATREMHRKFVLYTYDGGAHGKSRDASKEGAPRRKSRWALPDFPSKPKTTKSLLHRPDGIICIDDDNGELSSFFDNDDEELMLFLATFPEEEHHVRLRNEAKGVLGELADASSTLLNYVAKVRTRQQEQQRQEGVLSHQDRPTSHASISTDAEEERMMQMKINAEELRRRFEEEAREEYADLWQTLLKLRKQVEEQDTFLDDCELDIQRLSRAGEGEDRDAFAIRLTRDVNEYAKTHRLDLRQLQVGADAKRDYDVAVRTFLQSFALTRGRRVGRDVGCQCNPEDLGYVDPEIRRMEEYLEDLYFHARGLFDAIKLAIIAVGNVMSFHASLELESTCKRCFYIFENPRTLWPCGHTFCQQCLADLCTPQGELICDECCSLCEVGYTPNLSLELLASYQVVQHHPYDDDEDEEYDEEFSAGLQRRTIEGVLAALLKDLIGTQSSFGTSTRAKGIGGGGCATITGRFRSILHSMAFPSDVVKMGTSTASQPTTTTTTEEVVAVAGTTVNTKDVTENASASGTTQPLIQIM
ncbi:hypothetical protein LSM04_004877 [Trypanosoma melophagium]|uniref:uncharacterized protein n=1 Tax=Trypanosoma melophagium TaxID=715481 RepID=UPI00351A83DC|nr:hypothetical protein LSM04_004877 [Trypanosoma melophagium]